MPIPKMALRSLILMVMVARVTGEPRSGGKKYGLLVAVRGDKGIPALGLSGLLEVPRLLLRGSVRR